MTKGDTTLISARGPWTSKLATGESPKSLIMHTYKLVYTGCFATRPKNLQGLLGFSLLLLV